MIIYDIYVCFSSICVCVISIAIVSFCRPFAYKTVVLRHAAVPVHVERRRRKVPANAKQGVEHQPVYTVSCIHDDQLSNTWF